MESRERSAAIEDALNAAQVEFSADPRFLAPQAKHVLAAQQRLFDEAEKFTSAWFQRRHEATRSMIEASRRIASEGATDPAGAMKSIADWQAHSMERLAEDAKDCTEMMTRCAGAIFNPEIDADCKAAETTKTPTKSGKAAPA